MTVIEAARALLAAYDAATGRHTPLIEPVEALRAALAAEPAPGVLAEERRKLRELAAQADFGAYGAYPGSYLSLASSLCPALDRALAESEAREADYLARLREADALLERLRSATAIMGRKVDALCEATLDFATRSGVDAALIAETRAKLGALREALAGIEPAEEGA